MPFHMGLTQCPRCGGQISTNSASCPWCGQSTAFRWVLPVVLLLLLGSGLSFGFGLIRWPWMEQALGLDRGFLDQVQVTEASGATNQAGGDLGWRVPPAPDAAAVEGVPPRGSGGPAIEPQQPVAPPARVATVVKTARSDPRPAGGVGCADSSAVGRLITRYPAWSNTDLALIACGRLRTGFTADQVHASLGKPTTVERSGPARQEWHYNGVTVLVEQGRVISFGQ